MPCPRPALSTTLQGNAVIPIAVMYGYCVRPFAGGAGIISDHSRGKRGYCFRPFAVGRGQGMPCPYGVNPGVLWYLIPVHPRTTYGIRGWVRVLGSPPPRTLPIFLNKI